MKITVKFLSHVIKNRTEDPLVARNEIASSYYYYYSFPLFLSGRFLRDGWTDFLEIFRKDSLHQYLEKLFSFVKNSLPVGKYGRFSVFKKSFCPSVFSETVKDRVMKFSGIKDLSIWVCKFGWQRLPSLPVVTGSEKRNREFQTFCIKSKPIPLD